MQRHNSITVILGSTILVLLGSTGYYLNDVLDASLEYCVSV